MEDRSQYHNGIERVRFRGSIKDEAGVARAAAAYILARYRYYNSKVGTYPFHYLDAHEADLIEAVTGKRTLTDAVRVLGESAPPPPRKRVLIKDDPPARKRPQGDRLY